MSRLTVFTHAAQAEQYKPNLSAFRVSGLSVTRFVAHRVDPLEIAAAFSEGRLRSVEGPTTYQSKLRAGSSVRYSDPMVLDKSVGRPLQNHRLRLVTPVAHNAIWIEGSSVLLSAIPLKIQTPNLKTATGRELVFSPNFIMQGPIDVTEVVDLINQTDGHEFDLGASTATIDSLKKQGVEVIGRSSVLNACVGVDVWSLQGTAGREAHKPFLGQIECAEYSWALASILNYTSDHIVNHFFDQVSHEEVFDRIRHGFGFMQDHGIFTSNACVLEITHFGDWAPQRSWDRLETYGFDSSSLYLYGIALARNQSLREVSETSATRVEELSENVVAAEREQTVYEQSLVAARLLDRLEAVQFDFRESRSQLVDQEFHQLLGDASIGRAARQRVQEVRTLALDRMKHRQDSKSQFGMAQLAFAAAVLAVAAIPGTVEIIASWWVTRSWTKMGVSAIFMGLALLLTVRALSHRPSEEQ